MVSVLKLAYAWPSSHMLGPELSLLVEQNLAPLVNT
jgi:hypothetical protein